MSDEARDPAVEQLIAELPGAHAPAGWQARVFAELDAAAWRARRTRMVRVTAAVACAAAALLIVLFLRRGGGDSGPPSIAYDVRRGDEVTRGGGALAMGDTLAIRVRGAQLVETRVYLDGRAVLGCPGDAACTGPGDAALPLHRPGTLMIVGFYGGGIGVSRGTLEQDLEASSRLGIRVIATDPLPVR